VLLDSKDKTPAEIADIIERFVYRSPSDQQIRHDMEWENLLDSSVSDPELKSVINKCRVINRAFLPDSSLSKVAKQQHEQDADEQLKRIASQLREIGKKTGE